MNKPMCEFNSYKASMERVRSRRTFVEWKGFTSSIKNGWNCLGKLHASTLTYNCHKNH